MLATLVSFATCQLFPIGNPELANIVVGGTEMAIAGGEGANVSVKDMIVGIVPSDIITPFQESNMPQIIFLAVIMGLATTTISDKWPELKRGLAAMNCVCSKMTAGLAAVIPFVVFCSMTNTMLLIEVQNLLDVAVWLPVVCFGNLLMIGVYLLMLMTAGLNPVSFLKKYQAALVSAFTLCSSMAALPASMKSCDELGVSNKIYSFSLPLGATLIIARKERLLDMEKYNA